MGTSGRSRLWIRPRRFATAGSVVVLGALAAAPVGSAAPAVVTGVVTASSPTAGEPPLATSLLSPRRLPGWLVTNFAERRLGESVGADFTTEALGAAAASSCLLVTQGSTVLASRLPTTELIPASNMKLLTATAALDKLGPNFVYTTDVRSSVKPVGGVVDGNLYLVGSGDPVLRTAPYVASLRYPEPDYTSLAQLADQVVRSGVREITGSVVGDESAFDTERVVPTWKSIYAAEGDVGPLSALDVNDGFVLTGGYYLAAEQPAESAAQQFAALLAADGVKFAAPKAAHGSTTLVAASSTPRGLAGTTPSSAVPVTAIHSPPLSEIAETILQASDDTGAELLTKELGARFGGSGTTAAGLAVIRADLAADGLPVSGLRAADGSGLDRSDRVTCQLILDDLVHEGVHSVVAAGLPVAGKSGTLVKRLTDPLTAGRVLAKTGTLDDVSALSGFVLPRSGTPPTPQLASNLNFSVIIDGVSNAVGDALADRVAATLATYPDAPATSSVGPQ